PGPSPPRAAPAMTSLPPIAAGSAPKRIGINVSWMTPGQAGGMEWYVRNLIRELGALDDRHEWVVVTSPANWHLFAVPGARWTKIAYGGEENAPTAYTLMLPNRLPGLRGWLRRAVAWLRAPRMRRWHGGFNDLIRRQRLDLWFSPLMYPLPPET